MAEIPVIEAAHNGPIRRARASLAALETLDRLRQAPHTPASSEELATLRGWSGWGPLAPALESSRHGAWKEIGERIAFLLPEEHYNHGVQATYNAFYTPPPIASACWRILTDLGFTGGKLLEPGCGAGVFMSATPSGIPATWTGVERDPTTAAVARLLNPNATIHAQRLEETPLPTHSVDAVLGNVPFGDTKIYDPTTPRELTANLHNYFIYRAVQALRLGGVAILVTSRYTMDAAGDIAQTARLLISREAELLGAMRLPNDALTCGGAEPLVDILVLRRRRTDEPSNPESNQWITTGPSVGGQQVNTYFLANPHMVLGELAEDSAPRYGRTLRVDARLDDPPLEITMDGAGGEIVRRAADAGRTWRVDSAASPITAETAPFELRADGKKEGSFHLVDGVAHEVVDAQLTPVARPGKELPKLVALRDSVLALLEAEADHTRPDAQIDPLRAEANRLYDGYVKTHGCLNRYTVIEGKPDDDGIIQSSRRRPSMGGFRRDPDFVTVLALEDFDDDTRTARKAALLTRRVNRPRERVTHAGTPAEAIALCRDELGYFDAERVIELLGVNRDEADTQLAEVAFRDPNGNGWVPADEYLTGNVRQKLDHAKIAVALGAEDFQANIAALEAVQPADLEPEQITANLGAPWVPASDVQEFAQELLGFRVNVWHEPRTHTWSVTAGRRAEESAAATSDWGTFRLNAYQLLEYGLNGKAPVVYDVIDEKRVRNQDETLAANDRLDAIAARFSAWVWEDPGRADRLASDYNRTFNAIVPRRFDGAHLTFAGLDSEFNPYPHQRDMVARMISGDDALCPYPVGTGKTATMFMAAIKLKTLGLASKPLIIVVPSTLEQIARDGKRLFPNARILMAGKEDLANARARKLFAARCAMEDWDAVVMSHPSFTSLPVHPTVKADYVAAAAADYRSALITAKSDGAEPRKIKQIAKMVDNLEAEAKALLTHTTDDGVFFEHLGTDYLLVDEMHYFKNLGVPVHTDGFNVQGSKRAQDLDMKLGWLRGRHPDQAVITGFTGTPVSNTLLETFILQHYLQPKRLNELGLASADAWAASFVRFATGVEITPDGGFRLNRRPVEIVNVPDLMHTVAEFAELRPPEDFPVIRPDVHRHNVVIEASDAVRDYVRSLAERADDIRAGGVPSSEDNMLKICSDGRKVALHESLVGLEPEGSGKIGTLVHSVARIHAETKDLELPGDETGACGRLQLVFCDLGTPNKVKGNQVYGIIRQRLIAAGVPAGQIRFIHEATTDTQRLVLFDQCNKGEVAVLLGSTDKLGVGVNVQRRAIALHHVDAPWRPDQVEQREGRVWRPKNLNLSVDIYRYVTRDSFDAFMWQTLERKEKALRPILSGQVTARSVEDIGDAALDYGQIKAVASGNPLLAELNEVSVTVKNLSSLAASHQRNQRRLRADIQTFSMQASAAAATAEALEAVAHAAAEYSDDSSWRDTRGGPVPSDGEAALLGALAESTIGKGYCDGYLQWRGLSIDFSAAKQWRDTELIARVTSADRHRITVPLNVAWAAKGQHWRIRDAITSAVADSSQTAAATRANIATLVQRVAENEAALGQSFAEQAALDEARSRRLVLDAAIREQAQKDEEARRNRAARASSGASSAAREDGRDALLSRLHFAMTTVAERAVPSGAASVSRTTELIGVPMEVVKETEFPDEPKAKAAQEQFVESDDAVRLLDESPAIAQPPAEALPPEPEASQLLAEPETAPEPLLRHAEHEASPDSMGAEAVRAVRLDTTATTKSEVPQPSRRAARPSSRPAKEPERPQFFEQAVDLALQGFAVFPLWPGSKKPLIKDWQKRATTDPHQLARWWTDNPKANIAIACGPSNLLVIDLDAAKKPGGPRHGQETLIALAAGREITQTFTVASARGGRHLYFRQPDGAALRNTTGSNTAGLGPLIDTRGHGGFIVAPGSLFEGGTYRIERQAAVAPVPFWIVGELAARQSTTVPGPASPPSRSRTPITDGRRSAYGNAALRRSADTVTTAREGTRNDTLNREAFRLGRLVGGGVLDRNDVAAELRRAARVAGLSPGEAENTIMSGLNAGIVHPRSVPDRAPTPHTDNSPKKETVMSTGTTQELRTPNQIAAAPPNAADLHLPAVGLPETGVEPVHGAQQETGEQMAAAIREHETAVAPDRTESMAVEAATAMTTGATMTSSPESVTEDEATVDRAPDLDFEDIWTDVGASIERARQALPDWTELNATDDLKPAIDEVLRYLAEMPIPLSSIVDSTDGTTNAPESAAASAPPVGIIEMPLRAEELDTAEIIGGPANDLDEHLAAVDAAYADAQFASVPTERPEWTGIAAIHSAVHNLWNTIMAAAGTYWAELSADVRLRGLMASLASRAARAIASLATAAADRLEQRTTRQQPVIEAREPGLREAYISARNQVRAHAATHEWQRITALWGTVNTLARQAHDPGIRAVVARSAESIADYAENLGRKTSQYGHADVASALRTLATAAEHHAAGLRAIGRGDEPHVGAEQARTVTGALQSLDGALRAEQASEAQSLQARARQVAQHAQTRLGQSARSAAVAPRPGRIVTSPHHQGNATRPPHPSAAGEPLNVQPR